MPGGCKCAGCEESAQSYCKNCDVAYCPNCDVCLLHGHTGGDGCNCTDGGGFLVVNLLEGPGTRIRRGQRVLFKSFTPKLNNSVHVAVYQKNEKQALKDIANEFHELKEHADDRLAEHLQQRADAGLNGEFHFGVDYIMEIYHKLREFPPVVPHDILAKQLKDREEGGFHQVYTDYANFHDIVRVGDGYVGQRRYLFVHEWCYLEQLARRKAGNTSMERWRVTKSLSAMLWDCKEHPQTWMRRVQRTVACVAALGAEVGREPPAPTKKDFRTAITKLLPPEFLKHAVAVGNHFRIYAGRGHVDFDNMPEDQLITLLVQYKEQRQDQQPRDYGSAPSRPWRGDRDHKRPTLNLIDASRVDGGSVPVKRARRGSDSMEEQLARVQQDRENESHQLRQEQAETRRQLNRVAGDVRQQLNRMNNTLYSISRQTRGEHDRPRDDNRRGRPENRRCSRCGGFGHDAPGCTRCLAPTNRGRCQKSTEGSNACKDHKRQQQKGPRSRNNKLAATVHPERRQQLQQRE